MIAYWFSREDGTTTHLLDPAAIGKTHHYEGKCEPCISGLHASPTPWDALQYAGDGTVLWEVEIPDEAIPHPGFLYADKFAGKWRKYLRRADLEQETRLLARQIMESQNSEKEHSNDESFRGAIEIIFRYAWSEDPENQLAAAISAAWRAAWKTAWSATENVAEAMIQLDAWILAQASILAEARERFNQIALAALDRSNIL